MPPGAPLAPPKAAARRPSPLATAALVVRRVAVHTALAAACGLLAGAVCAVFARSLAEVTALRESHASLVWALPLIGYGLGHVLERFGAEALLGTKRIFAALEGDARPISWRMGPTIFLATLLTHLGGGSAGREGAAVQMGASVADALIGPLHLRQALRGQCLIAGMAGGFAAVFGTPAAAVLFALECARPAPLRTEALFSGIVAAATGRALASALGVVHGRFVPFVPPDFSPQALGQWLLFAAAVALCASAFVAAVDWLKQHAHARLPHRPWRMAFGGLCVVGLWRLVGTDAYLGLGDETIAQALSAADVPPWAFAIKALFTIVTLGFGFLGGEVTPLFFTGACLGHALAGPLHLPVGAAAAIGLAGLFAAAAKTPISIAVMAAEVFGLGALLPSLLVNAAACSLRARAPSIYGPTRRPAAPSRAMFAAGPSPVLPSTPP